MAALLLLLFLFRPGVYRLRTRIANSIGSALGRRVEIGNVRLRLLPRPGFDLEGLVIYDDPGFSAEPMMRAQEVSAAIRLRSLLRGQIEIATLSASEPSINLVRNSAGGWNLASLIERNAHIPAAPTEKAPSERRLAFPYLEASHARINFKLGQTKKSYALMDADVALWQDSANSWGARMKAAPVRTDFNLTDTGLLQISAAWQRSANLRLTPLQVTVRWQNGQLGQISKLLSGSDRGWRGGVDFAAQLSGTPEALTIESQTAIDEFHRYDIAESENVRLATVCSGQYNAVTSSLSALLCESPVGGGTLRLRGTMSLAAPLPGYDLTLAAEKVPLSSVVRLLREAKRQIPGDLGASGTLNAEFRASREAVSTSATSTSEDRQRGAATQWTGSGAATNVRLSSTTGKAGGAVDFGAIPLTLVSGSEPRASQKSRAGRTQPPEREPEPAEPHLLIGPIALAMNPSAPVNAGGWISMGGYRFFLRGEAELKDVFRLEDALGLPVARPAAEGVAKLDVSVSGLWQGFAPPVTIGTAQLRNLRAEMRGLNTPLEITAATMTLTPDTVVMQKISARTGNTHWTGNVTAPRHCAAPGASCGFQFELTADQFSTADLAQWFTPQAAQRPWYRIRSAGEPPGASALRAVQARGSLQVGRLGLKKVTATLVAAQVDVDGGKISLTGLRGQLLQGSHVGNWIIDASGHDASNQDASKQTVRYHGSGTLQNIALAQVGALMNDGWIAGTADGKFEFDGSGQSFRELLADAEGKLQFTMRNGSLPHLDIPGPAGPLKVRRFGGELHLAKGVWEISSGRLESGGGLFQVEGTASAGNGLGFRLKRDAHWYAVTGTLAKPRVAAVGAPAEGTATVRR